MLPEIASLLYLRTSSRHEVLAEADGEVDKWPNCVPMSLTFSLISLPAIT